MASSSSTTSSSCCCCSSIHHHHSNTVTNIIGFLVGFLLLASVFPSSLASSSSSSSSEQQLATNTTTTFFRPVKELNKHRNRNRIIRSHLRKINKTSLKTIQSPDGDTIDCVASHLQPAFDHPQLKGQKPLEPPDQRPKGHNNNSSSSSNINEEEEEEEEDLQQWWSASGESCPQGTVPIRRTSQDDIFRATSVGRFGRKPANIVTRDSSGSGHEHAVGYVSGNEYYGAKASLNVWAPKVTTSSEFSLSQIWVISGSFNSDLNTIEAGWQVSPQLYGDNLPRFFTYWTSDAYRQTGCYNLLCSGFVQTNNKIAIGAAISPRSVYNGGQFDISLLIWKDPKHGHWWLEFGSGLLIGYWPSFLFNHLARHGSMVQFGGEVVNSRPSGFHTSTQMGSGHFANEGFRRAAYFRNLQVVDWDNNLLPLSNLRLLADHSSCYSIQGGINRVWGNYFYYGGPGRCIRCP